MPAELEIRPLRRDDDRAGFSSGNADIDTFFRQYAGQNQFKFHVATTYVGLLAGRIAGFATVAVGSVERHHHPEASLRKRLPAYPLPVLRLARLGVDARSQGEGVGRALLAHVLRLAIEQRDALGCVGVVVDAKADAVTFYQSCGFVAVGPERQAAARGGSIMMFMPVGSMAAALPR